MPEASNKIIILFDSGAQAANITKKPAKRLNLENTDYGQVKFVEQAEIGSGTGSELCGKLLDLVKTKIGLKQTELNQTGINVEAKSGQKQFRTGFSPDKTY
ncbi:unnamed protein product [Brugia pahangi]|uniref:DUF1758 domain-containing protein n=1 Tax=Brugia pahangi TaxID=6280 RepID=A0A0N4T4Z5_BRUPA|nr:unnamed protein product [Brugia pahangi]